MGKDIEMCDKPKQESSSEYDEVRHEIDRNLDAQSKINFEFINIIKSPQDKRSYRILKLPNKLMVALVSDPETHESAAALEVGVGSSNEPDELPGLAHFCEHLLFMGTKKYPEENDFDEYLTRHGGSSNASTWLQKTVYYFDVNPDYFKGALDRFAQFFISPLLTESAIEREVNAVHLENERYATDDCWRRHKLYKMMYAEGHPFKRFTVGNRTTLVASPKEKGTDTRKELFSFYEKWYSSNIMTLAVLGKERLDDLEEMVFLCFSDVPNKNIQRPVLTTHYFDLNEVPKKWYVVPIKNIKELYLRFPLPYHCWDSTYYVELLMDGHNGVGSLNFHLKTKGWGKSVITSVNKTRELLSFQIKIKLTEEGMKRVNEIVHLVFQYLNMIKEVGPQKWFYDEHRKISEIKFKFKEKESPDDYVETLAKNLVNYTENVLFGPFDHPWKPNDIEKILACLKPSKMRLAVIGKEFESIADKEEPIYGTKYKTEEIPEEVTKNWEDCGLNEEFKFPPRNEFIPSNFEILYNEKSGPTHPLIIYETSLSRLWFKQDDKYLLPRTCMKLAFHSPMFTEYSELNDNLKSAYIKLLKNSLNEYLYQANWAGFSYDIKSIHSGIKVELNGYSDKQNIILDEILNRIVNFKVDPQNLENYKKKHKSTNEDEVFKKPEDLANKYLSRLIWKVLVSADKLVIPVEQFTVDLVEKFVQDFLSNVFIECLVHGNVDEAGALSLIRKVENKFSSSNGVGSLHLDKIFRTPAMALKDTSNYLYESSTKWHRNSYTLVYFQCGLDTIENGTMLKLLEQIIKQPCYDILRTEEQLGYSVRRGTILYRPFSGFKIAVESDKFPMHVNRRIEAFLIYFRERLKNMTEEEFENHKSALSAKNSQKGKQLKSSTENFYNEILKLRYDFNRCEKEVTYLKKISKGDFLKYFDEHIKHDGPKRRKISIHVISEKAEPVCEILTEPSTFNPPTKIENFTIFRMNAEYQPQIMEFGDLKSMYAERKKKKKKEISMLTPLFQLRSLRLEALFGSSDSTPDILIPFNNDCIKAKKRRRKPYHMKKKLFKIWKCVSSA